MMNAALREPTAELNSPTRVLVVEDDLLNRMFICAVLRDRGYIVEEVDDGAHVLAAARRFGPDLITMDINIPNVSGLEVIEQLQQAADLRDIPVLAVTAYVGRGEESRIRSAGASGFMAKPLSIKPFLAAVDKLLPAHLRLPE